jgi:ABC-type cobalamin/Fe3+-siderophores transport system ATPase subunit
MALHLRIRRLSNDFFTFTLDVGRPLFILGANGSGKSGLMHWFSREIQNSVRVAAHRQTWFTSDSATMSPLELLNLSLTLRGADVSEQSRWTETHGEQRIGFAIASILDLDNKLARSIASAARAGDMLQVNELSSKKGPIETFNELLRESGLPIQIEVNHVGQFLARKSGGDPYSITQLSDGERNAVLVIASVLTAKANALILIDEPEKHLYRSIIIPFLKSLFALRSDCAFVISTHDLELPLGHPSSTTILLRGCASPPGPNWRWDFDLLKPEAEVGTDLKREILGARRRILFVEGDGQSLDKPLYSIVFPGVSVLAKGSFKEVDQSVKGLRNSENLHWLKPFGIVDNDGQSQEKIEELRVRGVYALSVYSVESIYYHPTIQEAATKRHCATTGEDAGPMLSAAAEAAIAAIERQKQRLAERRAERVLREKALTALPGREEIVAGKPIPFTFDVPGEVQAALTQLEAAIRGRDLEPLIRSYPVRETGALGLIATNLGFTDREQYESTVRSLLISDASALALVRSFFGDLVKDLGI